MKDKKAINKKVEETLSALEGLKSAQPKPFLYTRVMSRLEGEAIQPGIWQKLLALPKVGLTALILLIVLNVFVVQSINPNEMTTASNEEVDSFISEYNLDYEDIYEINE